MFIATTNTSNFTLLIVLAFAMILVALVLLALATRKPHKMTKKDLDAALAKSGAEAKKVSAEALADIADRLAKRFEKDLDAQIERNLAHFDESIKTASTNSVTKFNEALLKMHAQAEKNLTEVAQNLTSASNKTMAEVNAAVENHKKMAIENVEQNLNNIVASYLNQSLEGAIDLGSQQEFIMSQLEKNKPALVEDLKNATG